MLMQFEMIKQEIRDVKNLVSQLLRQSVPCEEVAQLPQGVELPIHTMADIDNLEQLMSDAGDVRANVVGVLNVSSYLFEGNSPR